MTIHPLIGVGDIKLGSRRDEIRAHLGEPESVDVDVSNDGTEDESWEYEEIGLNLEFASYVDYRLVCIVIRAADTSLKGRCLIGQEEQIFLANVAALGLDVVLEADWAWTHGRDYVCDELGLSFWVQEGFMDSIGVMPQYDAEGVYPIWPSGEAVNPSVERPSGD